MKTICLRCEREGHHAKDCFVKRDIRGVVLPIRFEESDEDSPIDSDSDVLSESDSDVECDSPWDHAYRICGHYRKSVKKIL